MSKILITGCCGTIGRALLNRLASKSNQIICIDNNESSLFELSNKFNSKNIKFFYCDIRDYNKLKELMANIDICFHTAALKHVSLCEISPQDAIQTNIVGLNNLIESAIFNNIKKFIFTSSDKSVNPTNVMGASKLTGEKLITSANFKENNRKTIFTSVRFGNVIGSSGSVVPIFFNQMMSNQNLTLTDKRMTSFLLVLNDSLDLICNAEKYAKGGEIFISKMPALNIYDLALAMIDIINLKYNKNYNSKNISIIGSRPGEKMYEELINSEEISRTYESKNFFIVFPNFYKIKKNIYPFNLKKYNSKNEIKSDTIDILNINTIKSLISKNYDF